MIKVNFATTAPQFTKEDDNRRLFKTFAEKKNWIDTIFTDNEKELHNITLDTISTGSIKVRFDNLETGRNTQYLYVVINGFTYFYFVDTVTVVKADTDTNEYLLRFDLSLDTVTTYLDKLQFKGSTKVKRTHWDRFDKDGHINFDTNSPMWNNEPDIDAKPSIYEEIQPFSFKHNEDKVGVEEYKKHFAINGTNFLIYGSYNIDDKDTWSPPFVAKSNVPYFKLIAPLTDRHLVLLKKDPANALAEVSRPDFKYLDGTFGIANGVYTKDVIESPRITGIVTTSLPLRKHWLHAALDGFTEFYTFEVEAGQPNYQTNLILTMDADYDLTVKNPSYIKVDKTITQFNYKNEAKLYSSQYTKINVIDAASRRNPIINEFIKTNEENINIKFKEILLDTQTVTNIEAELRPDLSDYPARKISYISREQVPSLSSAYKNYLQQHLTAYKTGIEANFVKTGASVLAGAATGNPLGLMAAGASLLSGVYRAKEYKAQITDLRNTPDTTKGDNPEVLRDWDNIANGFMNGSVINYGIEIKRLSEIDQYNVAMHFNKYGYETEKVMNLKTISDLRRRTRFTYWECTDINNNIVKGSIPKEILDDITEKFSKGLRLWEPNTEINNYQLENWEL